MFEFLVGSIFVEFEDNIFQQTIDISMGTYCSTIANRFRYFYEAEFMHKLIQKKIITEAKAFILAFGHIDDVLWLNNPNFANMIPLIYPQRNNRNSFLGLNRQLSTSYYNKTKDFTFAIMNFSHLDSILATTPMLRSARACSLYSDCLKRHRFLCTKQLSQGLYLFDCQLGFF